ncbi:MAG: hypothetical protein VB855_17445, partial [Pirellulaceae bacterium]
MRLFENPVLNQIFHAAPGIIIVITFLILLLQKASGRKGATLAMIGCILFLLVRLGWIARTAMTVQGDFEIFDSLLYKVANYGLLLLSLASYGLWIFAFYSLSKDQDQLVVLGLEDSY